MAITSLDQVIAGAQTPKSFVKTGITMAAVGAMRGYTPWYAAGMPGAATANAVGINGAAVSGSVAGSLTRTNPSSGNAYLSRLAVNASQAGSLWLIDRLWNNSGLSVSSASAQAITPAALPARDNNISTDGYGVMAAIEWSATGGAGTPTVTLTYTDAAGSTGKTATFSGVITPPVGTFEVFASAAGDAGIRAPTSFIQTGTRTSGTMHLVLFRVIAQLEVPSGNIGNAIDAITGGMPRILDDSTLQLVWFNSATTAVNIVGTYTETHG